MLVTDLAHRDMEDRAEGLGKRVGSLFQAVFRRPARTPSTIDGRFHPGPEHTAHLESMPTTTNGSPIDPETRSSTTDSFRWRRHPQLLTRSGFNDPDPDDLERGARSAAVRGLFLARSGRLDEARSAFATAAEEPTIDLTAIPGFWDLSRGGMQAAVHAYEEVGRFREASALGARIRLMYRPRSIAALPDVVERSTSASGS